MNARHHLTLFARTDKTAAYPEDTLRQFLAKLAGETDAAAVMEVMEVMDVKFDLRHGQNHFARIDVRSTQDLRNATFLGPPACPCAEVPPRPRPSFPTSTTWSRIAGILGGNAAATAAVEVSALGSQGEGPNWWR